MNGYRVFQITKDKDGKETQGIYPANDAYQTADEAIADYEVRLGTALGSNNTALATYIMVMDQYVGQAVRSEFIGGDNEISPRLIDIKATQSEGEKANIAKYDTVQDVQSNFHLKLGRAMQNDDVTGFIVYGIDTHGKEIGSTIWSRTVKAAE